MPKPYTSPTLFDEALQISTTKLKEWGYLNPDQIISGSITWSRNGSQTGNISIMLNTHKQPFIELDYKHNSEPRNYKVRLVTIPSNLGKGLIWYFLCPVTNKRCRKLYLINGYFLHREAFKGCMYENQTQSKKWRNYKSVFKRLLERAEVYDELKSKHFKSQYAGKPTKRYLNLIRKIDKIDIEY